MKYTNLDIVQHVLSRLDSDEVDSVDDTTEARQVLELVRSKYFDIISRAHLPEHCQLFQLTASGDNDLPVVMYRPDTIRRIDWIKYHEISTTIDDFKYVSIIPFQQFTDMMHSLNPDETNVDTMTLNDFTFYLKNDRQPCYCTVLNDSIVIFDSYNIDVDTTLQSTKTMCYGVINPVFLMEDNFTPDLDDAQFPLLLNEVTALAFSELKQMVNPKAEQEARRQWSSLQKTKGLPAPTWFEQLPNFGRISRTGYSSMNRWMRERL